MFIEIISIYNQVSGYWNFNITLVTKNGINIMIILTTSFQVIPN